jgi:cysteinyl-tRNA synthetase
MHNGFLQVEGEKMSKSLGNFVTIREALADWPGEVVRLAMLRTHYRQPIDWMIRGLEESAKTLEDWHEAASRSGSEVDGAVLEALTDDINTPRALAQLHSLRHRAAAGDRLAAEELGGSLAFLGFLGEAADSSARRNRRDAAIDTAKVESLIAARTAARSARNFAESDRIRAELSAMGIALKDTKEGTSWEVAR